MKQRLFDASMKRGGENSQLSKEQYEALEEGDEGPADGGEYKRASQEVMATRKIVKRGQKFAHFGGQKNSFTSPQENNKPSNVFGSVSLTGSSKPENTAKPSNVFGSVSLTNNNNAEKSKSTNVFGSVSLSGNNNTVKAKPSNEFGSVSLSENNKKESGAKPSNVFGKVEKYTTNNSKLDTTGSGAFEMQKLNKSFLAWVDKQIVLHSVSNWTAGLQDYLKHAKKISERACTIKSYSETKNFSGANTDTSGPSSHNTLVKPSISSSGDDKSASSAKFAGFSMPKSSQYQNTEKSTSDIDKKPATTFGSFSGFSSSSSSTSQVSSKHQFSGFGSQDAVGASSEKKISFSGFGVTGNASQTSFTGFGHQPKAEASTESKSFEPSNTVNASASESAEGEYEGEPILEPEKIYRNENDTDEILFETDCKAFRFDLEGKEWKESGKGTLRITRDQGAEKKKILVRNTLGKITINSFIFKGMNFKKAGKAGMQFLAVTDASGKPQSFLVKVKPSEIDKTLATFKSAEGEA